jgi:hypothetical protein
MGTEDPLRELTSLLNTKRPNRSGWAFFFESLASEQTGQLTEAQLPLCALLKTASHTF